MNERKPVTREIRITGLVQGVGFRPFVYRMALAHGVCGYVKNTNSCVLIRASAFPAELDMFTESLRLQAPPVAVIENIQWKDIPGEIFRDFRIASSDDLSEEVTRVSPDIAVCDKCLADMKSQPGRIGYPFLNCTHCGPRFTIVKSLPYDRPRTTMDVFSMCSSCRKEYEDITDRRFHAQPVACWECGPVCSLIVPGKTFTAVQEIMETACRIIDGGGILAVKGMGGFHLACNALDQQSVLRLRNMKVREAKPFAVMFRDLPALREYLEVNTKEEEVLTSWRRPIVILKTRKELAKAVSNGFHTTGAMLPYMPLHYLLFEKLNTPVIVLTSGNLADEPILTVNEDARRIMGPLTDGVLDYNREIHNRTDDSVVMVVRGKTRIIRRSRGYVPNPIETKWSTEGIFAAGAELVNCFAVGKGRSVIMSQHIGDLKNAPTYDFYRESVERFCSLFRMKPALAACDLHPDYLSTGYAQELGVPVTGVQHHHAHMASVMAEHGLTGPCLGICFDGTGYGTDGHIWGGEFLIGDLTGFERKARFRYVPVPGGDAATREPWRMALSYLLDTFGEEARKLPLSWISEIPSQRLDMIIHTWQERVNAPMSCSAGRLFDAVSALLGICQYSGFHAEAPMRLENAAGKAEGPAYSWQDGEEIDFRDMFREMVGELAEGIAVGRIASRFHYTLIRMSVDVTERILAVTGPLPVLLSGGSFQNRILLEGVETELEKKNIRVYSNLQVPVNDGGIALGQMVIAAARKEAGML
ncbi:MAG: carbamoyltransferase HypF [Bacteroidales bacterium]